MVITNRSNLPQPFVEAALKNTRDVGETDFSVTELIDAPQVVALKKKHYDEIEMDVMDLLPSLDGQLAHALLERAGYDTEKRIFLKWRGFTISGQYDLYENKTLIDYKRTSVMTRIMGDLIEKTEQQLNLLDFLACNSQDECERRDIEKLQAVIWYKDWSHTQSLRDSNYPPRVEVVDVVRWSPQEQYDFLNHRLNKHLMARDGEAKCSPEEQWRKPEKFALMKQGQRKAVKLFNNQWEMDQWVDEKGIYPEYDQGIYYPEHRPGEATRCLHWCPVRQFCEQAKKEGNAP